MQSERDLLHGSRPHCRYTQGTRKVHARLPCSNHRRMCSLTVSPDIHEAEGNVGCDHGSWHVHDQADGGVLDAGEAAVLGDVDPLAHRDPSSLRTIMKKNKTKKREKGGKISSGQKSAASISPWPPSD